MKIIPEKRSGNYVRYTPFIKTQNIRAKIKKKHNFFFIISKPTFVLVICTFFWYNYKRAVYQMYFINHINQYIGTQALIECDCRGIFRLAENKKWENGECELYIWYIVIFPQLLVLFRRVEHLKNNHLDI
jgi:hypothetical protein